MGLKLALVGAGQIAAAHLHGVIEWNKVAPEEDRIEVSAMVDVLPGRARDFFTKHMATAGLAEPADVVSDHRLLLHGAHRPDLASILLPHHLHLDVGADFLNAGIAVQMQKPIGLAIRDARELIEVARRTGTALVVSEPAVLGRPTRLMIEWLRSGRQIGEPTLLIDQAVIDLRGGFFMTPWRHLKGMAGAGWFIDHGVHRTHWMLEALGPCETAFAFTRQIEPTRQDDRWGAVGVDTEDLACAVLRFRSGAVAQWSVVSGGRGEGLGLVRVWGTRGSLNGHTVRLSGEEQSVPLELPDAAVPDNVPGNPFAHSFMELVARVRDPHAAIVSSAERALEAEAIVYACLESALSGSPVAVSDIVSGRLHAYEDTVWSARDRAAGLDMTKLT
jgi:UDP-N-acetyl-2-amino-2-deoxyglucuronate dehydrogenase